MESAFGVVHEFSKGLKPQHIAALQRVAGRGYEGEKGAEVHYARARLNSHGIKDMAKPEVVQRMTISRGMYRDDEKRAVGLHSNLNQIRRGGKKNGIAATNPKIKYGRSRGHLRVVEGVS